jgi:hypothetical protein
LEIDSTDTGRRSHASVLIRGSAHNVVETRGVQVSVA